MIRAAGGTAISSSIRDRLRPYLPRLTLQWLDEDPGSLHRSVVGSMVFVDISGFTKLSERLARFGKVGAEEMADAINGCFGELLEIAYEGDGSLLKFGGDALLILFSDDGGAHAERAVRAAWGMRQRLRSVGAFATTGGRASLRMSVGVHSGTFDFFLVGGSHRELLVTGPAATRVVEMEGTATAGEIVISASTAEALPRRCVGNPKGDGFLLRSGLPEGEPIAAWSLPEIADEALLGAVSVATRETLLGGSLEPEHRPATLAFIHFDGTDRLIAEQGAAVAAAELDRLVRDTQSAVDELGVCFLSSDVDADGGKLILSAGAPTITGNDEERMLLALRQIADPERGIPIRIGVNRGGIFAGDIGPRFRRTYTVMGDAVNLAARLMARASPGEIYASESVLERAATRFATTELEPFMVKGKAKPVQAWAVGPVLGTRTRDQAVQLQLIGRDEELADLRTAFADARGRHGWLIEVVGEPGIGKSRLTEELEVGDARVLRATAESFTSSTPYVVWRELLRGLLGVGWEADDETIIGRLEIVTMELPELAPWIPLLAVPLDIDVPQTPDVEQLADAFRQAKLHEVVGTFLSFAMREPTWIHVEDAHLMDGSSAELFRSLLGDLGERPWLITLTRRDASAPVGPPDHERVREIGLGPLSQAAVEELLERATERSPLLPHLVATIAERSGGNPQFALDLAQVAAEGGALPESIETAAMARIDALTPADRALVRRASVLGVTFARRFVDEMLDENTPPPDDAAWERLGEFFADDGDGYLRFRRAVVREAAYDGLPFRTRKLLHARAAARFEREFDPEETGGLLSLHFHLAGEHAEAYRYARAAAARAAAQSAHQESALLYGRAIDAGTRLPDVTDREIADLYRAMSESLFRTGELRAATEASAGDLRHRVGDPVESGRALLKRARIQSRLQTFSRALWWISRARTVLAQSDTPEAVSVAADAASLYAVTLNRLGRTREAARWGRRAIEEAEASGNERALAEAYDILDTTNMESGQPTGAYWDRALEIYGRLRDLSAQQVIWGNRGVGLQAEGRFDEAMTAYERSRDISEQIGDAYASAILMMNEAEIHSDRGSLDVAEDLLQRSVRFLRASGDTYMIAGALEYLGRALARLGRTDEALAAFAEAEEGFVSIGPPPAAEVRVLRAECLALLGDPHGTLEAMGTVGGSAELSGAFHTLMLRIEGFARAQTGDPDSAQGCFEGALDLARERRAGFEVFEALVALRRLAVAGGRAVPGEWDREIAEISEELGIVAVTSVPLAAT
ncbi:MAG: adenylate/guanylate cyclase domain-containing protein [Actinomycetota bacterium]